MQNISSSSQENYYCYGCWHTFSTILTQLKFEQHHELCKNKKNRQIKLRKEGKNTISHKFGSKSRKVIHIILLDLECILEKNDTNENNENIPRTIKKDMHTVCG